jgi:hypothetical protein
VRAAFPKARFEASDKKRKREPEFYFRYVATME